MFNHLRGEAIENFAAAGHVIRGNVPELLVDCLIDRGAEVIEHDIPWYNRVTCVS